MNFEDIIWRQQRKDRPGRVPFLDNDYTPYTDTIIIDAGGIGYIDLPGPQLPFARKWVKLTLGVSPGASAIAGTAICRLGWRHPTGEDMNLVHAQCMNANLPVHLIGGMIFSVGQAQQFGIDPVIAFPKPLGILGSQGNNNLQVYVTAQTASTNIRIFGRYTDLPL